MRDNGMEIEHRSVRSDSLVEPLRCLEAVRAVKALLAGRPRDLLLFTLGINNGLRAGDLLRTTVNRVRDARPGATVPVPEKQTGALVPLWIPPEAWDALQRHLELLSPPPPPTDMYLFASERGWTPLTLERLEELVAQWTRQAGISGRFGAHTLRKTFGYLQRTVYGVGFDVLARFYHHASPQVTMRYLGLTPEAPAAARLTPL